MGVPKKKTTITKRGFRQSHQKVAVPAMVECSHCHALMQSHHVCPSCGYYEGRKEKEIVVKEHKKKMKGR